MSVRVELHCDRDVGSKRNESVVHVGRVLLLPSGFLGTIKWVPHSCCLVPHPLPGIWFFYTEMFAGEQQQETQGSSVLVFVCFSSL